MKIIALMATPYRIDGDGLGSCGFSTIIHGPDTYSLTRDDVLCAVKTYIPRSENTQSWTPKSAAHEIALHSFNKGIVFCKSVKDSKETAIMLNELGIKSASIDGGTDADLRSKLYKSFVEGDTRVVCNHTIFTEGVDVPITDLVVLNRHTNSRCLWKQMVGRGTRKAKGKHGCKVLDLAGNGVTHGSIYDKEIYDLDGRVESTESRQLASEESNTAIHEYIYNQGEELKEWQPKLKPAKMLENLRQQRSKSPLHRLRTGLCGR